MAPPAAPPNGGGGGNLLTQKFGPLPAWGWLAVAVVGFILWRRLSGNQSNATASGTPNAVLGPIPTETITTGYGSYTGPPTSAPPWAYQAPSTASSAPSNPAPAAAPVASPGGGPSPAMAQVTTTNLAGGTYDVLGGFHGAQYTGYNVSTGEPVYFTYTGQGTPQQGPPPAGASGVVLYTPTSTPITKIGNHVNNVPAWSKGYTG